MASRSAVIAAAIGGDALVDPATATIAAAAATGPVSDVTAQQKLLHLVVCDWLAQYNGNTVSGWSNRPQVGLRAYTASRQARSHLGDRP